MKNQKTISSYFSVLDYKWCIKRTNYLVDEAEVTLRCCLRRPTCSKRHWRWTRPQGACSPSVSPRALSEQGDTTTSTRSKITASNQPLSVYLYRCVCVCYLNGGRRHLTCLIEVKWYNMGEAAGVWVHGRGAVAKRLQDGVDGLPLLSCKQEWRKKGGDKEG